MHFLAMSFWRNSFLFLLVFQAFPSVSYFLRVEYGRGIAIGAKPGVSSHPVTLRFRIPGTAEGRD